jgi:hypothetical protein
MTRESAQFVARALILLTLIGICSALAGCTVLKYEDNTGRKIVLLDLRFSGSAARVGITRPDGTIITVSRDQDSPADAIEAAANIIRPPWRLP